jgi:cytochrome P450
VRARAHELVELTAAGLDYAMFRARVLLPIPLSWPLPINRRFRDSQARLDAFIYDLMAARRADSAEHNDLLTLLLEATGSDGRPLSDAMIRDEIMTMIVAGYETVATGLTWTWHLLAREPAAAAQLRAELAAVLAGRAPTLADLPQLPFLRMVVEEAWRLYPPAWLITRRATAADEIGGAAIPAGAVMVISPYVLHHSAEYWPDPDRFDPSRFRDGAPPPSHCTFLPFGAGPRLCIGNRLAEMEAQLILATLVPHFAPAHATPRPVGLKPLVTIRPRGGLPMQLRPVA